MKNENVNESVSKGVVDYLVLSDAEKQLYVSNLAGVVVLAFGAILPIFLTKFSSYVPYLIFVLIIFNLSIQYIINKVKLESKKLEARGSEAKIQQLFTGIKSVRILVSIIIFAKITIALI